MSICETTQGGGQIYVTLRFSLFVSSYKGVLGDLYSTPDPHYEDTRRE